MMPVSEAADRNQSQSLQESPAEAPWLQIDLEHSENGNGEYIAGMAAPVHSDYQQFSNVSEPPSLASVLDVHESGIPVSLLDKLNGDSSTQRAAALADLTDIGGEEAFELITNAFD